MKTKILCFTLQFLLLFNFTLLLESKTSLAQSLYFTVDRVIRKYNTYYTQGLIFSSDGKYLIESGGLYGKSALVRMAYPSLNKINYIPLNSIYFAEGIAVCGNYLYMLTYRERTVLQFSYPNLSYVGKFAMDSNLQEGWGLASFGPNRLIASDGTSNIYILDCNNYLKVIDYISVTFNNAYLTQINSLTYAQGFIWANVYFDRRIFKIDPNSGNVVATYDMTPLINYELSQNTLTNYLLSQGNVLNGIAYNPVGGFFVLTGKLWGNYYQITFK